MSVRSGTCPQPRTTASAPGSPPALNLSALSLTASAASAPAAAMAPAPAPAPAPTAADAPHYAIAPGAYNMQVWWQQELARQAAEAAEEPAEAMEAEEEPAPAALVRERSQDDEGPAAQRARTNPNADDEIDFENATVMVRGTTKNFYAIDEADQMAMTDDEYAEFARLHAAERAAYPEAFEPDAAADADGADGADDAGDDALHDHSSSGQAPAAAASSSSAPVAPAAGPPMPVPNRRPRKILSRRRKDRRETLIAACADTEVEVTKVALVRVHGNSQAWKTAVRLWRNQVRAVLGWQAVEKNPEDTPLELEYEQLVPKTTPLDHAAWAPTAEWRQKVADAGGDGGAAFRQTGVQPVRCTAEVDEILRKNGELWMKGQTGKAAPLDQANFLFNGPRYEPGVGPADKEGKPMRTANPGSRPSKPVHNPLENVSHAVFDVIETPRRLPPSSPEDDGVDYDYTMLRKVRAERPPASFYLRVTERQKEAADRRKDARDVRGGICRKQTVRDGPDDPPGYYYPEEHPHRGFASLESYGRFLSELATGTWDRAQHAVPLSHEDEAIIAENRRRLSELWQELLPAPAERPLLDAEDVGVVFFGTHSHVPGVDTDLPDSEWDNQEALKLALYRKHHEGLEVRPERQLTRDVGRELALLQTPAQIVRPYSELVPDELKVPHPLKNLKDEERRPTLIKLKTDVYHRVVRHLLTPPGGSGLAKTDPTEPVLFYGFVKREQMLKQRAGFEYGHDAFNRQPSTCDGGRVRLSARPPPPVVPAAAAAEDPRIAQRRLANKMRARREKMASAMDEWRAANPRPLTLQQLAARVRSAPEDAAATRRTLGARKVGMSLRPKGRRGSAQAAGRAIDSAKSAAYAELEEKLGAKPSISQMLAWNERQFDLADEPEGAGLLEWINEGNGSGPTVTDWTRWAQPPAMWFDGPGRVAAMFADDLALWLRSGPWDQMFDKRFVDGRRDLTIDQAYLLLYSKLPGNADFNRIRPFALPASQPASVGPGPADGANRWRARPEDELEYKKRLFDWVVPFELGLLYPATSGNAPDGTSGLLPHLPLRGEAPLRSRMSPTTTVFKMPDSNGTRPTLVRRSQHPLLPPYTDGNGRLVVGERDWRLVPDQRWHAAKERN